LCARYSVTPGQCAFIDDSLPNVEGARRIGMRALQFTSIDRLLEDLEALGVSA
jgi:2-haloacid dehalogenase